MNFLTFFCSAYSFCSVTSGFLPLGKFCPYAYFEFYSLGTFCFSQLFSFFLVDQVVSQVVCNLYLSHCEFLSVSCLMFLQCLVISLYLVRFKTGLISRHNV